MSQNSFFFFFFQGEDAEAPSDRRNADMRYATNTLFEMTQDDVLQHCTNEYKCLCCRSYRGQAYHSYSNFMHVHGAGNQISLAKPVLAYYRAAWYFDKDVAKNVQCPPLDERIIEAIENEVTPSEEVISRFVDVLRRVYG